MNQPEPSSSLPAADWEAFYRDYRKPGYVSGYEITSKLGGGMFGLVYKATKQSIGKDYAIKFLKVDDGEVRRAVLQELEQVRHFAQVDHPNLVAIEDRGEVDGIPYLVMAYAGSQTLQDQLPGDVPQRPQLVNFFLQACRGVAALHERSLVHFDLKPANIFLKGNVARVGDYGLSKLVAHSGGSLSMGRGTPYYMAPEVLQRRGDQRSDVYSLGVMLYEILVGRVPFTGDSEWEVLKQHEQKQPAFPPELPRRERAVLERCLQKDPAQRFQQVAELLAAMGAESSVAAAAYAEVRAGTPMPPPLPGAKAPPPPPFPTDDSVRAFGRAAREAATHAGHIARAAALRAREIARKVHKDASGSLREALQNSREARRQVRQQRRDDRAAAKAEARRVRQEARARHSGWGGAALVIGMVLLGALLFVPYVTLRRQSSSVEVAAGLPAPTAAAISPRVPSRLATAVSLEEPDWVGVGLSDQDLGQVLLDSHLAKFIAIAPLPVEARLAAPELPDFGPVFPVLDVRRRMELDQFLQSVRAGKAIDATKLQGLQRAALLEASEQLERTSTATAEGLRVARNLQSFLETNTGFHRIELAEAPDLSPAQRALANQSLGRLWRWFLNEAAPNDRAWQLYLQLRR